MNTLQITGTVKTPFVSFTDGLLEISGKSIPENSIEFYQPIYNWIDQYAQQPAKSTSLKVRLEYFNTSSSKCLLDVFRKLETIQKSGRGEVTVTWMYEDEDEDMMEAGEDYSAIVTLPFTMEKIKAE
jgi:hypothetical protein